MYIVGMKKKIMFILTSETNLGDLALCQDWIEELGREDFDYCFMCSPAMNAFIDNKDHLTNFHPEQHIRTTILNAYHERSPHLIIFATNAFWNLSGYKGCKFGEFVLREGDVDVPVLSFDPFEMGFEHTMPQSGEVIPFSAVPDWVYALRYLSTKPATPNARHFYSAKIFDKYLATDKNAIIKKWGGKPGKKSVFFPMSRDRYNFIRRHYPRYYEYLREIFAALDPAEVQVFTVFPERVVEFEQLENIIQLPLLPYDDFLGLISASDLYLTDSFISCIVTAFNLEVPALVLVNSTKTEKPAGRTFLENDFFPFSVFPYGMEEICTKLEKLFELENCYVKSEIFDQRAIVASINELLRPNGRGAMVVAACREWKQRRRESLATPLQIINNILIDEDQTVSTDVRLNS